MNHRGIEYAISRAAEPDTWQWRFEIGGKVHTGKTETRLAALAAHRARVRIDRALKLERPEAE